MTATFPFCLFHITVKQCIMYIDTQGILSVHCLLCVCEFTGLCHVYSGVCLSGFAARQTRPTTRSSILSGQHVHRRWDSHVAAVGRAARLHELDVGLWLDPGFTVCSAQPGWPARRQCSCFGPTSSGHWMQHSPWYYCSAGKHCTVYSR